MAIVHTETRTVPLGSNVKSQLDPYWYTDAQYVFILLFFHELMSVSFKFGASDIVTLEERILPLMRATVKRNLHKRTHPEGTQSNDKPCYYFSGIRFSESNVLWGKISLMFIPHMDESTLQ